MCLPPREEVANCPTGQLPCGSSSRRTLSRQPVVEMDDDRVTFQEEPQVHMIATALSCLGGDQDRHHLWYNREDIQGFRQQAQILSRKGPRSPDDECTRGLELRMSLHRQDRKQMVVKRILDAQEEGCTPDQLARISQRHSTWSLKLAIAQAHKDYYAAYHPTLTSVLPEMPLLLDCSRGILGKRSSLLGAPGRRVRCRMF